VREKIAAHFEDQTTTEPAVPATIQTTLLELSQNLPTVSSLGSPPEIAEKFKLPEEWFLKNGAFHDPQSPFPEQKAIRKSFQRAATQYDQIMSHMPNGLVEAKICSVHSLKVIPSVVRPGLQGLMPARRFAKDEEVLRIRGKWENFTSMACDEGHDLILQLQFTRGNTVSASLGLRLNSLYTKVHWINISEYANHEVNGSLLVCCSIEWDFSASHDKMWPAILLFYIVCIFAHILRQRWIR
jgi:hypothetical protein